MSNQDGLGLAAQTVNTVGEDAAHIAGAVIELADRNQAALSLIRRAGGGDLGHLQTARTLGGTTRCRRQQRQQGKGK
ncbi:hypothetical protein D3C72_1662620 [compost metagenome]